MYAVIDIETTGLNRYKDQITWVGISLHKKIEPEYNPYRVYTLSPEKHKEKLLRILKRIEQSDIKCVWQNGKFDTLWLLEHYNINLPISDDVMLMGTVYDLSAKHGLKIMAQEYLGVEDWDIKKKDKLSGNKESVVPYLKKDLQYTYELYAWFRKKLTKEQKKIYRKLLLPAYKLYQKVEEEGIYFNLKQYKEVKKDYAQKEADLLKKLNSYAEINWNSSQQKADVLYNKMKLPILKQTPKGAPSTDKSVLKRLAGKGFEVPKLILDYSAINTLNKMFLARWGNDCINGRLHPSFNLTSVVSGRTSSSNPNLQQCYDDETEVLTLRGFKLFKNLEETDKVAQWDTDGSINFVRPTGYLKQYYKGDMVSLQNTHIDLVVTPNHRCLLKDRKKYTYRTVLADNFKPDYQHIHAGIYKDGTLELSKEHLCLIAAIQADAEITLVYKPRFKFTKRRKAERLKWALDSLKLKYTWRITNRNQVEIVVEKKGLDICKPYINKNKHFTYKLLNLTSECRDFFLKELREWDGLTTRKNNQYTSISKRNVDVVQILYTLNNTRALLSIDVLNYIKSDGVQSIAYRVYETDRNYSLTTNIEKEYVPYDGYVYCVEVPSSYIVVRRNGKTSVSGNCPNDYNLRSLFTAPKGRLFFEADYSQLELRIAAHYANEKTMLDIYHNDGDIHTATAQILVGEGQEVTKADRQKSKSINFGFLYGMQAKTFQGYAFDSYGVTFTMDEAEEVRSKFFEKYSGLVDWHHKMEILCEREGGVSNLFGRFRALPDIYNQDKFKRMAAIRRAINTPVQGTGSDILLSAAVQVYNELSPYGLKIVGTVHDSILGEFNEDDKDWIVPEISKIMEHPKLLDEFNIELKVPLKADIGVGPWGSK